jgi:hypothetical protein
VAALLVLHLGVSAVLLPARLAFNPRMFGVFTRASHQAPDDEAVPRQTFVFVNGNELLVNYVVIVRSVERRPTPARLAMLGTMMVDQEVTRHDERTLSIRPEGGFLRHMGDRLMTGGGQRFEVGWRLELPDYAVEVTAVTREGRPAEARYEFRLPLEDPSLRWLYWKDGGLQEFPLPRIGETIEVTRSLFLEL